jgi:hypothetical protein
MPLRLGAIEAADDFGGPGKGMSTMRAGLVSETVDWPAESWLGECRSALLLVVEALLLRSPRPSSMLPPSIDVWAVSTVAIELRLLPLTVGSVVLPSVVVVDSVWLAGRIRNR